MKNKNIKTLKPYYEIDELGELFKVSQRFTNLNESSDNLFDAIKKVKKSEVNYEAIQNSFKSMLKYSNNLLEVCEGLQGSGRRISVVENNINALRLNIESMNDTVRWLETEIVVSALMSVNINTSMLKV